jgi:GGDEF domain-containing protein
VISIKSLIGREQNATQDLLAAQHRTIVSLLDGMAVYAVPGDSEDFARLQVDITSLRRSLRVDTSAEDLLISTGSALKSFQDYNQRTTTFVQAQGRELQKITSMLTEAIVGLSSGADESKARLQEIERQIEKTSAIDDIRKLKERLSRCLIDLREERMRQSLQAEKTIGGMKSAIPGNVKELDDATGLGSRPDAETALAAARDSGANAYVALFTIDHLHGLNSRFGRTVGDRIIMLFAQHLAQSLNNVYRWSGPAFLAIFENEGGIERAKQELIPALTRLETTIEVNQRTVLVPINYSWVMHSIREHDRVTTLIHKLDEFMNSKHG